MLNKTLKPLLFGLSLLILMFTVDWSRKTIDHHKDIYFESKAPVFLPNGQALKWLSMGYRGLMADALWIRSVLYYGRRVKDHDNPYYRYEANLNAHEHHHHHEHRVPELPGDTTLSVQETLNHILFKYESQGLVDFIYPMLDRVTTLDPHFIHPYIFGGVYVLMDTGEIDQALALLEKGKTNNPDAWQFPFFLGWVQWMYKNDIETARQSILEALGKPECPLFVRNMAAALARNSDNLDATMLYLRSLYQSTDNPEIKERLADVLHELQDASR